MIQDKLNTFAEGEAVDTSGTGEQNLGDVIDLGTGHDLGAGVPQLVVQFQVTTAITSGGAATVEFQVVSDAVSTPAVDATQSYHGKTGPIPVADLIVGAQYTVALQSNDNIQSTGFERYLGVQLDVAVAALTAGAVDASLTPKDHVPNWTPYPAAID